MNYTLSIDLHVKKTFEPLESRQQRRNHKHIFKQKQLSQLFQFKKNILSTIMIQSNRRTKCLPLPKSWMEWCSSFGGLYPIEIDMHDLHFNLNLQLKTCFCQWNKATTDSLYKIDFTNSNKTTYNKFCGWDAYDVYLILLSKIYGLHLALCNFFTSANIRFSLNSLKSYFLVHLFSSAGLN